MPKPFIQILSRSEIRDLLSSSEGQPWGKYRPEGLFIGINADGTWCAMDNLEGDCWTEDFASLRTAVDWLNRRQEMDTALTGKRHNVRAVLEDLLSRCMSEDYAHGVADALEDEVFEDVCVSASEAFNYDDVRLAIGRALCRRLDL